MRKLAIGWTMFWVLLAIPFSAAFFYYMQFNAAEKQFAITAQMTTTLKRSQIFSGDIRTAELQIRRDLNLTENDRSVFLDESRKPWIPITNEVKFEPCEQTAFVCRDLLGHKLIIYQPIFFDEEKTTLWGYLYLEQHPVNNWNYAIGITLFFFLIMLIQNFGFYFNVVREVSSVSKTLADWALKLKSNPKSLDVSNEVPYEEIEPIQSALGHLNKEIGQLEAIARTEGALKTLRGVGHDILNPVSRIKRILGIMKSENPNAELFQDELFMALNQNVKRLSEYAEQLKFMYKRKIGENPEFASSNVSVEVRRLVSELQFQPDVLDRKIEVTAEIQDDCLAKIPSAALGRIVENICSNGILASHDQGSVRISVSGSNEHVMIEVEDFGSGIPAHIQSSIFEAGFTSRPNKGTGLGLFVVKQICDQYGGTLEVKSSVGFGTRVRIDLPRMELANAL